MSYDTCLCMGLRSAAQQLTRKYDSAINAAGITVNQFSLMSLIRSLEEPTMKDLAEASGLDRSTLGRNLRVLEKQALISLKTGEDARTRVIHLTREGRAAFRRAAPLWQETQESLLERLGPEKRLQLQSLLDELTATA